MSDSSLCSILSHRRSNGCLNDFDFEDIINKVKGKNSEGGFSLYETSGALKFLLQERKDVHVIYNKAIFGDPECDCIVLRQEILNIHPKPRYVVFPYAITTGHQISVVIDFEESRMTVTDSLKTDRSRDPNLLELKNTARIRDLVNGNPDSFYRIQMDNWSCGVYTVCNTIHRVNQENGSEDRILDVNIYLEGIIIASEKYSKIEAGLQMEREERKKQKRDLLEAVERLRDENGYFRNPDSSDDLRKVADALQLESWGNLNRKEPDDNPNRTLSQEDHIRERDIQKLVDEFEKNHKDDILGIVVLYCLMRGGKYRDVITYQREALRKGLMEYSFSDDLPTTARKSMNLGTVYVYLRRYDKAQDCFEEAMEESKELSFSEYAFVCTCCHYALGIMHSLSNQQEKAIDYFTLGMKFNQYSTKERKFVADGYFHKGLGLVYYKSEKHVESIHHYKKAKEMFTSIYGPNDGLIAMCLLHINDIYREQGKLRKAENCGKKAKEILEKERGSKSDDVAGALNDLAITYILLEEMEMAEECAVAAKNIYEVAFGSMSYGLQNSLGYLGRICLRRGELTEARKYFEGCKGIARNIFGVESLEYAICLGYLGDISWRESKYEEARQFLTESNVIFGRIHNQAFSETAINLGILSDVYSKLKNKTEALDCISRSISLLKTYCGSERKRLCMSLFQGISICCELEEPDKAKEYFQEASYVCENSLMSPEDQQQTLAEHLIKIAEAYREKDQFHKSLECLKQSEDIVESIIGPACPDWLLVTKTNMANCYFFLKDYDQAIVCLKQCEKVHINMGLQNLEGMELIYRTLIDCYSSKGNFEKAVEVYQKAKEYFQKANDVLLFEEAEQQRNLAIVFIKRAEFYQNGGRYDKAIECLKSALDVAESNFGPPCPYLIKGIGIFLGRCYFFAKEYDQAISYLKQAEEIIITMGLQSPGEMRDIYNFMINCYLRKTNFEEGFAYLSKGIPMHYGTEEAENFCKNGGFLLKDCRQSAVNFLNKVGQDFLMNGHYDNAVYCLKKAKQFMAETVSGSPDPREILATEINMGRCYFFLKKYDQAIPCLEKSVEVLTNVGLQKPQGVGVCYYLLGYSYRNEEKFEEGFANLNRVEKLLQSPVDSGPWWFY